MEVRYQIDIKIAGQSPNISDVIIINSTVPNNVEVYDGNSTEITSPAYLDLIDNSDYLQEYNETESNSTVVRKCCEVDQFFSLVSGICESIENSIPFYKSVFNLLENSDRNITYQTGTLKVCPETTEPPSIISDITNSSYSILNSGVIVDKISQYSFNQTHYCLELVGTVVEEAALTLAYCLDFDYDFEFYDYASDHEEEPQEIVDSYVHIVRKCCGEYEFYSTTVHKCIAADTAPLFPYEVQRLSFESNDIELKIISSRIHECPDKSVKPKIIPVDPNAFRLIHTGDIIEVENGLHHNYSYYCLEMVGENENKLTFTLALCSQTIEVPKCCPSGKYFDDMHLDCLPQPENNDNYTDILSIFKTDLETYSTVPIGHFLRCQNTFPVQDEAENLFIKGGKLCNNLACFEKEDYCIDYIGKDNKDLKASAFYCQKEYFVKCCKEGYILSIKGCTEYNDGKSVLLEHLTNTRNFVNSFDTKICRKNKGILLDQTLASYVIWWVSNDGSYLTVSAEPNKKILHNYCIDDFIDNDGHVGPGAYVCESDVNHLLPNEHHFLRYSKKGSLGKCCPENVKEGYVFYYSSESHNCEIVSYNESLKDNIFLKKASFIEEHFHDFPECPSKGTGYHSFPFQPGEYDHADISSEGVLKIISKDGKCTLREDIVEDRDYCIEYVPTINGELKPAAFLCAYAPETTVFEEKYIFITVCISISCFCLLCTLIYLFTVQVKRGFVTVRKVNTLAAGFVQFFNLATFCWNTSICLESLLLTIDISISKCIRYLLHSLWAWGFPFAITLIMFVMDAYREELPCGIITPKIGVAYCFHSDSDSKLVYFYVPILFTLIANLVFIFGAKAMRRSRLKKLEKGQRVVTSGAENRPDKASTEGTQAANSGMRTHQNLNTKTESVRLVLWTGTTWFSELAGFILTRYVIKQPNEHWYNYLWYIPTSFNALRGAGILGIIVLLPEKRKIKSFFMRTKIRLRKLYKAFKDSAGIEDSESNFRSSTQKSSFADIRRRNMSVTTMISTLSSSIYNPTQFFSKSDGNSLRKASIGSYLSSKWESLRKTSSNNINNANNNNERSARKKLSQSSSGQNGNSKPMRKLGMIRSVSQIDRRASNSSGNSFIEELEMEEDYGKRKCSIPLPKLQEEESYMEREESSTKSTEKTNEPCISES
ncbi:putative G-protein coupled receptor Mth-like 3, partial [Armadillidium nasatum]